MPPKESLHHLRSQTLDYFPIEGLEGGHSENGMWINRKVTEGLTREAESHLGCSCPLWICDMTKQQADQQCFYLGWALQLPLQSRKVGHYSEAILQSQYTREVKKTYLDRWFNIGFFDNLKWEIFVTSSLMECKRKNNLITNNSLLTPFKHAEFGQFSS